MFLLGGLALCVWARAEEEGRGAQEEDEAQEEDKGGCFWLDVLLLWLVSLCRTVNFVFAAPSAAHGSLNAHPASVLRC